MLKDEAVKGLKSRNIKAEYDRGIVMIYAENGKPTFEETKKILKEMGYQMSFGYHRSRSLSQEKNTEGEKEAESGEENLTEADREEGDMIGQEESNLSDFLTDDEGQISFSF